MQFHCLKPAGGLQNHLINLENYCRKWNLSVIVSKTKIVVIRKGCNLGQNDKWFYAGEEVEVVNGFAYLGVVFSSECSFIPNTKTLFGKALQTMHQLLHEVDTLINIALNLFIRFPGDISP